MNIRNKRCASSALWLLASALLLVSCQAKTKPALGSGGSDGSPGGSAVFQANGQDASGATNPDGSPIDSQNPLDSPGADAGGQAAADGTGSAGSTGASGQAGQSQAMDAAQLASTPVYSPSFGTKPGLYAQAVSLSLSAKPAQALIMYTTDGSTPSPTRGTRYTGAFSLSSSAVVKAMAYIPGGNTAKAVSASYTIGELCVAPGGSGDGTLSKPMGSINAAIAKAQSLGIAVIKLQEGSFIETVDVSSPISLSGGWKAGFLQRSSAFTRLAGKEPEQATSKMVPAYALRLSGARIGASLVISNLSITGPEASYSAGIVLRDGAAPVVRNCESRAGFSSYGYGALVLAGASPSFVSCTLHGGEGATSFGLSVDSAKAVIRSSYLLAGSGTVSGCGLSATDASVSAYSSVLAGAKANLGYGAALYNSKGSRFEFCTLLGGYGKETTACFVSEGNPVIASCIIASYGTGKSYGIVANYGQSSPSALSASVFLSCASALFYDADTKLAYSSLDASGNLLSGSQALSEPKATACILGAFSLGPEPRYESPAGAMAGLAAGSAEASPDIRGKARSGSWTPGAYQ